MTVFKQNLTSKMLVSTILNDRGLINGDHVLDFGCGDGNIIRNLFYANPDIEISGLGIDICADAIDAASHITVDDRIKFKVGDRIPPTGSFSLVISDVAGIASDIAEISGWYDGVSCETGWSGLDLVEQVLSNCSSIIEEGGVLYMPIISLSDTKRHEEMLSTLGDSVRFFQTTYWPLPESLQNLAREKYFRDRFDIIEKFGVFLAWTKIAKVGFGG